MFRIVVILRNEATADQTLANGSFLCWDAQDCGSSINQVSGSIPGLIPYVEASLGEILNVEQKSARKKAWGLWQLT